MSFTRAVRPLVLAALLVVAAGCSSSPSAPPTYKLDGDACGAVPLDIIQPLAGVDPTKTPSDLTEGLQGGNCEMEFDGTAGYLKLVTFIAIQPNSTAGATSMYTKFKTDDSAGLDKYTTVADLKKLGTAAYVQRQHEYDGPWKPADSTLYKIVVEDGTLVLSVIFSGFARTPAAWPSTEQALQDKVEDAVKKIMAKLAQK
jgi:hypothetical protein